MPSDRLLLGPAELGAHRLGHQRVFGCIVAGVALGQVRDHWRGIGVTLFVNWAVKPFSMALLAWVLVRQVFAAHLPADQLDSYVAGLILLAAAPCTAMVFVWSRLTGGDPYFTLSQVALNDAIMVFAYRSSACSRARRWPPWWVC